MRRLTRLLYFSLSKCVVLEVNLMNLNNTSSWIWIFYVPHAWHNASVFPTINIIIPLNGSPTRSCFQLIFGIKLCNQTLFFIEPPVTVLSYLLRHHRIHSYQLYYNGFWQTMAADKSCLEMRNFMSPKSLAGQRECLS